MDYCEPESRVVLEPDLQNMESPSVLESVDHESTCLDNFGLIFPLVNSIVPLDILHLCGTLHAIPPYYNSLVNRSF
jgi:hypothetical protein